MSTGPTNSATPTTSQVVGGVFNATPPTPNDTQACALQLDAAGNLKTTATISGGTIIATNASVGVDGAASPGSSTQVGGSDGTNLQPLQVDGSKNLKVTVNTPLPAGTNVIGHVIVDSQGSTVTVAGGKTNNNAAPGATNVGVLPGIANAAAPTYTEGDQVLSSLDLSGNTRVIGLAASSAEQTAAWTSATAGNTTLQLNTAGYSTVIVTLNQGTTITGGVVTAEVSDTTAFTNAYIIQGTSTVPTGGTTVSGNFVLVQATNTSLIFNVAGFAAFRIRLSTVITGTGTVNVGITGSAASTDSGAVVVSSGTVGARSANAAANPADNNANSNFFSSSTSVVAPLLVSQSQYGGAFSGTGNAALSGFSKVRMPTIYKTASVSAATTGNSAIWTPGAGNKFRLLGFQITAQGLAATATAAITVKFQDATTDIAIGTYDVDVPAVANVVSGVSQISGGPSNLGGFGVLSAAANNVLNFNISAAGAGTVGTYRVTVWGVEE